MKSILGALTPRKSVLKNDEGKVMFDGIVVVELLEASGLATRDLAGFRIDNPYVKFRVGKSRHVSRYVRDTTNPVWNERFTLVVLRKDYLHIKVRDKVALAKDKRIGTSFVDLTKFKDWETRHLVLKLENVEHGTLTLNVTFLPMEAAGWRGSANEKEEPQVSNNLVSLLENFSTVDTSQQLSVDLWKEFAALTLTKEFAPTYNPDTDSWQTFQQTFPDESKSSGTLDLQLPHTSTPAPTTNTTAQQDLLDLFSDLGVQTQPQPSHTFGTIALPTAAKPPATQTAVVASPSHGTGSIGLPTAAKAPVTQTAVPASDPLGRGTGVMGIVSGVRQETGKATQVTQGGDDDVVSDDSDSHENEDELSDLPNIPKAPPKLRVVLSNGDLHLKRRSSQGGVEVVTSSMLHHHRPGLSDEALYGLASTLSENAPKSDVTTKLNVWIIHKGKAELIAPSWFGNFYSDHCFLIAYETVGRGHESAVIYFWLGKSSSRHDQVTSAFFAKMLEDKYKGNALQGRVVEGNEPLHLLSIFNGHFVRHMGASKITPLSPALATGDYSLNFTKGLAVFEIDAVSPVASSCTQIIQSPKAFLTGKPLAIVSPKVLYMWFPPDAEDKTKYVAIRAAQGLAGTRLIETVEGGNEPLGFLSTVGATAQQMNKVLSRYVPTDTGVTKTHLQPTVVSVDRNESEYVYRPEHVSGVSLDSHKTYILDNQTEVYLWVGKQSPIRVDAIQSAMQYVSQCADSRTDDLPVFRIDQGYEPSWFTKLFSQ